MTALLEIPHDMRDFAEIALVEAENAAHRVTIAEEHVLTGFDKQVAVAHAGTKAIGHKMIAIAAKNTTDAFEHARRLVWAKDPSEMAQLQLNFAADQSRIFLEQAQDLGQTIVKAASAWARS